MAPSRIGGYEVQEECGRDGAAVIYRGAHAVIGRRAALKVLHKAALTPGDLAREIERLRQEARVLGALAHPNILAIYDYAEDESRAWIAIEWVEGRTLADHLASGWRPEIAHLPSVIEDMLAALDHAHARGVVHGALRPGCILVSTAGAAKLAGFGAVAAGPEAQTDEAIAYRAPEQLEGAEADERADLYSAGILVYEVLTGRRPFAGSGAALVEEILYAVPPPASTFEPRLPVTVDMALARALAKRPESRHRGARAMLQALAAAFPGADAPPSATTQSVTLAGNIGALRRALGGAAATVATAPVAPAPATPGAPRPAPAPAPKLPSALFVDDEERVLNALRALFRDRFEIEIATSGAQALERLRARRFHVLVSDQRMPGMQGVELLREARQIAPDTVRLLLTGYADLAAIIGSVNEGEVFRFISKPWQEEELRATLAEAADVAIALEALAARPSAAPAVRAAVLVLGEEALARAIRALARERYPVLQADDVESALATLAREEIGALVCDLDAARGEPGALLRVLKRGSPQTQLIAVSAAADSEAIIGLINEARILRFLKKPPNLTLLEAALGAALERYARLQAAPALARAEQPKQAPESAAARSILERLRTFGGRLGAAFRS